MKEQEMVYKFQPRLEEPEKILLRVSLDGRVHFGPALSDVDMLILSRGPAYQTLERAVGVLINEVGILRDKVAKLEGKT